MNNSAFCIPNPAGPGQIVAYTGTAGTITNAFPPGTVAFMAFCTTTAYIAWGTSPTADNTGVPLPANQPVIIRLQPAAIQTGGIKVSAIQETTGGNLHVLPLAEPH